MILKFQSDVSFKYYPFNILEAALNNYQIVLGVAIGLIVIFFTFGIFWRLGAK